jgi:RNase adaptor protein for sRNA GlmZ degradation
MDELTIYTWGNKHHKRCPVVCQKSFNVAGISNYKPRHINLKKVDGRDEELQKHISKQSRFEDYMESIVKAIDVDNVRVLSVYCHKGRHRSVATAELLKKRLEKKYTVRLVHLDL